MGFESAAYCVHEKVIRVRVQLQCSSPPTCSVTSHQVSNCGALSFQVQAFRGYGL